MYSIKNLIKDIKSYEEILSISDRLRQKNINNYEINLEQISSYKGICTVYKNRELYLSFEIEDLIKIPDEEIEIFYKNRCPDDCAVEEEVDGEEWRIIHEDSKESEYFLDLVTFGLITNGWEKIEIDDTSKKELTEIINIIFFPAFDEIIAEEESIKNSKVLYNYFKGLHLKIEFKGKYYLAFNYEGVYWQPRH